MTASVALCVNKSFLCRPWVHKWRTRRTLLGGGRILDFRTNIYPFRAWRDSNKLDILFVCLVENIKNEAWLTWKLPGERRPLLDLCRPWKKGQARTLIPPSDNLSAVLMFSSNRVAYEIRDRTLLTSGHKQAKVIICRPSMLSCHSTKSLFSFNTYLLITVSPPLYFLSFS